MPMLMLFLKRSPFIRIVLPFIIGINIAHKGNLSFNTVLMLTGFFLACYIGFKQWMQHKLHYQYRYLSGILGFIILLLTGVLYLQLRQPQVINSNDKVIAKVELIRPVGQTSKNYKYEVYLRVAEDSLSTFTGCKGIVYLAKDTGRAKPDIGDTFLLKGRFIPFSKPDHRFSFDYSNYLVNHRIAFRIISEEYKRSTDTSNKLNLMILIAELKQYVSNTFKQYGMADQELAILNALYLGDKSQLTYEQKEAFSAAGAMHLLAVSGLHVGIIYLLMLGLINAVGLKKKSVLVVCILIVSLWIYALITGLSPSVLRASIMFTILEVGRLSKLKTGLFNLLGASMFIIILMEPQAVFNIGFWLSHCAVASIVCFYPLINNWFYFRFPPFRWLWSVIAVSLAAQIATVPISIYAFNTLPLYFILSNILLIPIVSPLLIIAVLASVFSFLPFVPELLIPALGNGLSYMGQVAFEIKHMPQATLTNLYIHKWQLIFIYTSIILLLIYINSPNLKHLKYFLLSLMAGIGSYCAGALLRPSEAIIVANIKGKSVVNYIGNKSNQIYTCSPLSHKEISFAFKGIWAYCGATTAYSIKLMNRQTEAKPVCKQINGEQVLIVPPLACWTDTINTVCINKLILMNQPPMTLEEIGNTMHIKEVVIANGWKKHQKNSWLKDYTKHVNYLHDVYEEGTLFIGLR